MARVKPDHEEVYRQYAAWKALTKRDREVHGLPGSQKEFAARHNVAPKTLRRWQKHDEFEELVNEHRSAPSKPTSDDEDDAEALYRKARAELVRQAMDGQKWAIQEYYKQYGQHFVEAERALLESSFADLSDRELYDRILAFVGIDYVKDWVDRQE